MTHNRQVIIRKHILTFISGLNTGCYGKVVIASLQRTVLIRNPHITASYILISPTVFHQPRTVAFGFKTISKIILRKIIIPAYNGYGVISMISSHIIKGLFITIYIFNHITIIMYACTNSTIILNSILNIIHIFGNISKPREIK